VIISQHWSVYNKRIKNAKIDESHPDFILEKWSPFITDTIIHFSDFSSNIIIIGGHVTVAEEDILQPTIFIDMDKNTESLEKLHVTNFDYLANSIRYFDSNFSNLSNVYILHPQDLFCTDGNQHCVLHDGKFSFFRDDSHLSSASTPYVVERLGAMLIDMGFFSKP
jgi:hypothetical protein